MIPAAVSEARSLLFTREHVKVQFPLKTNTYCRSNPMKIKSNSIKLKRNVVSSTNNCAGHECFLYLLSRVNDSNVPRYRPTFLIIWTKSNSNLINLTIQRLRNARVIRAAKYKGYSPRVEAVLGEMDNLAGSIDHYRGRRFGRAFLALITCRAGGDTSTKTTEGSWCTHARAHSYSKEFHCLSQTTLCIRT